MGRIAGPWGGAVRHQRLKEAQRDKRHENQRKDRALTGELGRLGRRGTGRLITQKIISKSWKKIGDGLGLAGGKGHESESGICVKVNLAEEQASRRDRVTGLGHLSLS